MLRAIDTHDITMDYQPKYRLADGALVGAEALVRWRREGMIIPPNEFLPLLSDVALWDMTQYCLRCVVQDSLEFPTSLPMSINIDPVCLNSNLVALIKDELALWNVDPARLMLEITEAGVIQNHTESFGLLQAIRARPMRKFKPCWKTNLPQPALILLPPPSSSEEPKIPLALP